MTAGWWKQRRRMYSKQWESLPDDIMRSIFQRLSSSDDRDLFSAAWVCQSWQSSCPDLFIWDGDTLDLNRFNRFIKHPEKFSKLLRKAMEDEKRCAAATCIYFPQNIFLSSEDLIFVAQRTPRVKRLIKLRTDLMDLEGFSGASQCWKAIERAEIRWIEKEDMVRYHAIDDMADRKLKRFTMGMLRDDDD